MAVAKVVLQWLPHLLKAVPIIVKFVDELVQLWSVVKKKKTENDKVVKSMKLLKKHQGSIDQFLEDPGQRQAVMEGLVILMTKVQKLDKAQISHGASKESASEHCKCQNCELNCDICTENFNTTDRKPMLLPMCGHTLCKSCLGKLSKPLLFRCHACRKMADRPVEDFPPNISLLALLSPEEDFTHCDQEKSEYLTSSSITLSYEEQIEYALFLSRQYMDLKHEKHADSLQSEAKLQKETENFCDDQELSVSDTCQGQASEEDEASLQLALSLWEKEIQQCKYFEGDKKNVKMGNVKEQEDIDLAMALSLSLQEESDKEYSGH